MTPSVSAAKRPTDQLDLQKTRALAGADHDRLEDVMLDEIDDPLLRRVEWDGPASPLVSVAEAAEILGVAERDIWYRMANNSLQGVKTSTGWAIVRSTLHHRPPGRPRIKPEETRSG